MTLIQEFRERAEVLCHLDFRQASGRIAGLLDWMESQQAIKQIIEAVRRGANGSTILLGGSFQRPPPANTSEEIAAVGLTLMEACRNGDFAGICHSRGIHPNYSTSRVQAYVDAGLETYVLPFLVEVERRLQRADFLPTRIADRKFDDILLGEAFAAKFPETRRYLEQIGAEFLRADNSAAWQNIGNMCRQALLHFCDECVSLYHLELPAGTKRGDAKAIARELIRKSHNRGRFADSLEAVIAAAWDHAQSITHRSETSCQEAMRAYLWTGLVIDELSALMMSE